MKQLITAFMIGILFCLAILKSCTGKEKTIKAKEQKREIKNAKEVIESSFKKFEKENRVLNTVADSLKSENDKLSVQLKTTRFLLRQKQNILASDIPCDSIKKEALSLNELTTKDDSLCNQSITVLDSVIMIRESQIKICNDEYKSLYDLQSENLKRQLKLADELETAYKANRKKRFENKMLTCGLLIISGITTTMFIKSNQ